MSLYVGTNYHPHDWEPKRWQEDIALMKQAGFVVARLGHLCWDSYEPEDGIYTFEWFDKVMDTFHEANMKVILDVSVRPAPIWVHKLCPGCDIYSKSGVRMAPLRRYMEDVDDPDYQHYALRFAEVIVKRYKDHPVMLGFGLCNEQGDGFVSYGEAARIRFQKWLKKRYKTIELLNIKWNTKRWSRRLLSFEDIELPENELAKGAPEAYLDMRRFYGDGVLEFMKKLAKVVEREAPGMMHSSNHVAEHDQLGFDYLKGYEEFVDHPGFGFYPHLDPTDENTLVHVLMYLQHRLGELGKPMWCLEFQTGDFGCYAGAPGVVRMYALLCLIYRSQMVLAWTWRSMLGGEEQFYFGLLDHDGTCGCKYDEFARIASDYKKLEQYSLPYLPEPEVAIAYCYENIAIYDYAANHYRKPYKQQIVDTMKTFYYRNLNTNIIDLRNIKLKYKLIIIPGHAIMSEAMAANLTAFVQKGGIVIMTGYSAKVNEYNTVFDTPQPGLLDDVFGIRSAGFERVSINAADKSVKCVIISSMEGATVSCEASYWEKLELTTAKVYATYVQCQYECAVAVNQYGKGYAYYVASETNTSLLGWLYDRLAARHGFEEKIDTPKGVVYRKISSKEHLYVNTTGKVQKISVNKQGKGVLGNNTVSETLILEPYDGELLVME